MCYMELQEKNKKMTMIHKCVKWDRGEKNKNEM